VTTNDLALTHFLYYVSQVFQNKMMPKFMTIFDHLWLENLLNAMMHTIDGHLVLMHGHHHVSCVKNKWSKTIWLNLVTNGHTLKILLLDFYFDWPVSLSVVMIFDSINSIMTIFWSIWVFYQLWLFLTRCDYFST
jgi:hypothetical protein